MTSLTFELISANCSLQTFVNADTVSFLLHSAYLCYVGFSASDFHFTHSCGHCPCVVVSAEAELKPCTGAEADHTHPSQARSDRKRVDELCQETFNCHVPVVLTTASFSDNTRRVIKDDSNLRLLRTHCTHTNTE